MKTISLIDIKEKLNDLYNSCDELDTYHIDTSILRGEIISVDNLCDSFSDDNLLSNTNVQVKKDKNVLQLYNRFTMLEKKMNDYLNSIRIFKSIEKVDKSLTIEELNPILEEVLNDLLSYEKTGLDLEEFKNIYDKLYTLIKLEFRYTGHSNVLNFIRSSRIDSSKIDELYFNDYAKYIDSGYINNIKMDMVLNKYQSYDKGLLLISVLEDGYINKITKELSEYKSNYSDYDRSSKAIYEEFKNVKANNKMNQKLKRKVFERFIPVFMSLVSIATANYVLRDEFKDKSLEYNTTTEIYDTFDGWSSTTSYGNFTLGDTDITVYNPVHSNGARVIKTYKFVDENFDTSDLDNYNFDDIDLNSSEYKYNESANDKSLGRFVTMERISNIDYNDSISNPLKRIGWHILASLPILIFDALIGIFASEDTGYATLTLLTARFGRYMDDIKYEIESINKKYLRSDIKLEKGKIKYIEKKLKELNKEYTQVYEKYSHLEEILNEKGYERKLKRGNYEF